MPTPLARDNSRATRSMATLLQALASYTLFLLILSISSPPVTALPESDALLRLKASLENTAALSSWTGENAPCNSNKENWLGVLCWNGTIWGLQLESMELAGTIDVDALKAIPTLRTVSFMNNSFTGPIPELGKHGVLKSIFLSKNKFSGTIPAGAFNNMGSLKKVYLSENEFSGDIPASLAGVPRLLELRLEKNGFTGAIPDFRQVGLRTVNVSYNQLVGQIPERLSRIDPSAFTGNKDLCGEPLQSPCKSSSTSSSRPILAIAAGATISIGAVVFIILKLRHGDDSKSDQDSPTALDATDRKENVPLPEKVSGRGQRKAGRSREHGTLVFVRDNREKFGLQDLLKASAEVLGSGSVGSSYKAELPGGPVLVVKRFREMNNLGREGFHEHMARLGRLSHPNLLPVLAFYYMKEEKLLVFDYVPNGSLVYLLHGNKSPDRPILDWLARLRIIKGVARGLAYLHQELPDLVLPHGHLKSSNILLTSTFEPLLMDYALSPAINRDRTSQLMVAYKSPESIQPSQATKKSDVWSLGILILEILTGKFPTCYLRQGKGSTDLDNWVKSISKEEWTADIFDDEMGGIKEHEGEMLKLLQIGLGCCEGEVKKRWELNEAIEKIEELNEKES